MKSEPVETTCVATTQYSFFGPIEIPADVLAEALRNPDAVQVALEFGRLDWLALLVTCLAILISLAAVFGFIEVRSRANIVARQSAEETARVEFSRIVPSLVDEAVAFRLRGHVATGLADQIAVNADGSDET